LTKSAHSVCQPGLPSPQGDLNLRPIFVDFHKEKSLTFLLSLLSSLSSSWSKDKLPLDPYFSHLSTEK